MESKSQNYSDAVHPHRTDRKARNFFLRIFGPDSAIAQSRLKRQQELSQKHSEQVPAPATAGSVTNGERRHKYNIFIFILCLFCKFSEKGKASFCPQFCDLQF